MVTKSVSRLARNTADFLTIVRTLLDLGIPIYFEKENIDTGSMENELMLSIMSSIAESESVSISENNKWSIQRKFKNGTYKCSYPPYGYDWDKKNGEMVVNPEQAEIVRYIFAQTLAGVGTHDIAKDLMAKGVPTKKGGKWTGHTVNGIIRNEKYTGDCLFQNCLCFLWFYNCIAVFNAISVRCVSHIHQILSIKLSPHFIWNSSSVWLFTTILST